MTAARLLNQGLMVFSPLVLVRLLTVLVYGLIEALLGALKLPEARELWQRVCGRLARRGLRLP